MAHAKLVHTKYFQIYLKNASRISALMLLGGPHEWHPACKNFCFKTSRDSS